MSRNNVIEKRTEADFLIVLGVQDSFIQMQKFVCDFIHAMFEAKFQKFVTIETFSIFNLFSEKCKQKKLGVVPTTSVKKPKKFTEIKATDASKKFSLF